MRKQLCSLIAATLFVLCVLPLSVRGQDETPTKVNVQNRIGDLPFSTSIGTDIEHVDAANGNLIVRIPFLSVKGRGLDFNFFYRYDAKFWTVATRTNIFTGNPYQIWNIENRAYAPTYNSLGWRRKDRRSSAPCTRIR